MQEFKKYSKIPRIGNTNCYISEKLDGTNAIVFVDRGTNTVLAGSRTRWLSPGKETDNYNFAEFVENNTEYFLKFPDGYHYGEWVGPGINRGYKLNEKTLFLFSHSMGEYFKENNLKHTQVQIVPLLQIITLDQLSKTLQELSLPDMIRLSTIDAITVAEGVVISIDNKQLIKVLWDKHD